MNELYDVILICGSDSDKANANKVLAVWKKIGLNYCVSVASCHKHGGGDFANFILNIPRNIKLIVFIGGMSLAAPGLIDVIIKKADRFDSIVFGIPTDIAARSAIEDLPKGTVVITAGLNMISLSHSLINNALAVARLMGMLSANQNIIDGQKKWHADNLTENPLRPLIELNDEGLIP